MYAIIVMMHISVVLLGFGKVPLICAVLVNNKSCVMTLRRYKKADDRSALNDAMVLLLPLIYQMCNQLLTDQSEMSVTIQKQILKIFFALIQVGQTAVVIIIVIIIIIMAISIITCYVVISICYTQWRRNTTHNHRSIKRKTKSILVNRVVSSAISGNFPRKISLGKFPEIYSNLSGNLLSNFIIIC